MSVWKRHPQQGRLLFLKKKKQKDARSFGFARAANTKPNEQSFFGSFFSKKELLSSCQGRATGVSIRALNTFLEHDPFATGRA